MNKGILIGILFVATVGVGLYGGELFRQKSERQRIERAQEWGAFFQLRDAQDKMRDLDMEIAKTPHDESDAYHAARDTERDAYRKQAEAGVSMKEATAVAPEKVWPDIGGGK